MNIHNFATDAVVLISSATSVAILALTSAVTIVKKWKELKRHFPTKKAVNKADGTDQTQTSISSNVASSRSGMWLSIMFVFSLMTLSGAVGAELFNGEPMTVFRTMALVIKLNFLFALLMTYFVFRGLDFIFGAILEVAHEVGKIKTLS